MTRSDTSIASETCTSAPAVTVIQPESNMVSRCGARRSPLNTSRRSSSCSQFAQGLMCEARRSSGTLSTVIQHWPCQNSNRAARNIVWATLATMTRSASVERGIAAVAWHARYKHELTTPPAARIDHPVAEGVSCRNMGHRRSTARVMHAEQARNCCCTARLHQIRAQSLTSLRHEVCASQPASASRAPRRSRRTRS